MSDQELESNDELLNTDTDHEEAEELVNGLVVQLAKEGGWADKTEWRGKPEDWTPADKYVERQLKRVASLEDRLRRQDQVNKNAIQLARQREREIAEEELRQAIAAGNADRAVAATQRITQHPAVEEFQNRNSSWIGTNIPATQLAVAASQDAANRGLSAEAQVAYAQQEVEKRFPELFDAPDYEQEERVHQEPAPRAQRQAPSVQPATRNTASPAASAVKGWKDVPRQDRDGMREILHMLTENYHMTKEAAQANLAETYWNDKNGR